jgi:hypothetical protein
MDNADPDQLFLVFDTAHVHPVHAHSPGEHICKTRTRAGEERRWFRPVEMSGRHGFTLVGLIAK